MSTLCLFSDEHEMEILPVKGADIRLYRSFLGADESRSVLETLLRETPWQQDEIHIAGKRIPIPRLQAWYGDPESFYAYSGLNLAPLPWTSLLIELRERLQKLTSKPFNSVLVNYYRDGFDSVSWHSDNERELGSDPVIASLSLGATRTFRLRLKSDHRQRHDCHLDDGSLLVMGPGTQRLYEHQVPKEKGVCTERLNLTFRQVFR